MTEFTLKVKEENEKNRAAIEENYADELQKLREKRQTLLIQRNRIHDRLMHAYPALLRGEKRDIFEKIKKLNPKNK